MTAAELEGPGESRDAGLSRSIGPFGLGLAVFNMVVGAGIFVLPAALARDVGSAAPLAFVICMVAMSGVVLCFAAASSRVASSGGPYGFVEVALGPLMGFLVGVLVWIGSVLAAAGIAAAVVDSLAHVFPVLDQFVPRAAAILVIFTALALFNSAGASAGTRLMGVLTALKLVPLAIFLGVGAAHIHPDYLKITLPRSDAFGRAVLLAMFAFQGSESALGISGEVRHPHRNIPLGLLTAMGVIGLLYLAIQLVTQGVLGPALGASKAPLSDALLGVSPWLAGLLIAGATVSMLGYLSGDALSAPRVLFAFARDGFLPRFMGGVNSRTRAPVAAIVAHVGVAAVLAISGSFVELAVLSTLAILGVYLVACVAAVILQRRDVAHAGPPLHLPFLELAALIGIAGMGWVVSQATRPEAIGFAIALAFSLAWYAVVRGRKRL